MSATLSFPTPVPRIALHSPSSHHSHHISQSPTPTLNQSRSFDTKQLRKQSPATKSMQKPSPKQRQPASRRPQPLDRKEIVPHYVRLARQPLQLPKRRPPLSSMQPPHTNSPEPNQMVSEKQDAASHTDDHVNHVICKPPLVTGPPLTQEKIGLGIDNLQEIELCKSRQTSSLQHVPRSAAAREHTVSKKVEFRFESMADLLTQAGYVDVRVRTPESSPSFRPRPFIAELQAVDECTDALSTDTISPTASDNNPSLPPTPLSPNSTGLMHAVGSVLKLFARSASAPIHRIQATASTSPKHDAQSPEGFHETPLPDHLAQKRPSLLARAGSFSPPQQSPSPLLQQIGPESPALQRHARAIDSCIAWRPWWPSPWEPIALENTSHFNSSLALSKGWHAMAELDALIVTRRRLGETIEHGLRDIDTSSWSTDRKSRWSREQFLLTYLTTMPSPTPQQSDFPNPISDAARHEVPTRPRLRQMSSAPVLRRGLPASTKAPLSPSTWIQTFFGLSPTMPPTSINSLTGSITSSCASSWMSMQGPSVPAPVILAKQTVIIDNDVEADNDLAESILRQSAEAREVRRQKSLDLIRKHLLQVSERQHVHA